jgi:hypothetical protein
MWTVTDDGSVVDQTGRVLFFSTQRFIDDICLGDCCFICGAKPEDKAFNNEHILPDWVLRRYDLFARKITLPNGNTVRYDRYTVPCCVDCNSLMGREIEEPISRAVHAGPEALGEYTQNAGLNVIIWMGLIFLKTYLKDRKYRVHLDRRKGDDRIADQYDWEHLHHLHSFIRCLYTGCRVDKEAVGSFLGISVKGQAPAEKFDYGDLYFAQTMFVRLDDIGLVTVFNDCGAAMTWFHQKLERIKGPVSELQLREIMVDFAYLNLHLEGRSTFESECDIARETCRITGQRGSLEIDKFDRTIRGRLMEHAFRDVLRVIRHPNLTDEEFSNAVRSGGFTFLFDDQGEFISDSVIPAS